MHFLLHELRLDYQHVLLNLHKKSLRQALPSSSPSKQLAKKVHLVGGLELH
jgi:hypothetical protein